MQCHSHVSGEASLVGLTPSRSATIAGEGSVDCSSLYFSPLTAFLRTVESRDNFPLPSMSAAVGTATRSGANTENKAAWDTPKSFRFRFRSNFMAFVGGGLCRGWVMGLSSGLGLGLGGFHF